MVGVKSSTSRTLRAIVGAARAGLLCACVVGLTAPVQPACCAAQADAKSVAVGAPGLCVCVGSWQCVARGPGALPVCRFSVFVDPAAAASFVWGGHLLVVL